MRTPLLVAGAGAAITAATLVLGQPTKAPQGAAQAQPAPAAGDQVKRGEYLTSLGDCVACHTQQGGAPYAGGRPVETPFGTVVSANITPDKDTGIGTWSADQFWRAMHEGIDDQGKHLYPAFPYNYYTNVTRQDSDAIYAYLRTLPPVHHQFKRDELKFPFNIRALMAGWNEVFLHEGPEKPDASKPAQWNRGRYLVEGLGHCGACHTPKNFAGAPKHDEAFRGGTFGEWFAPDITENKRVGLGGWDDASLHEFLRRGTNVHSAASGEMGDVVAFSTSRMNDADIDAVIAYLRGIAPSPDAKVQPPDAAVMNQGKAIWQDACSACHQMDASGVPRYFPPLRRSANLQQSDPTTLVHYILAGSSKTATRGAPTQLSMPAFDWKLDDAQVAAVATFARNSWGNAAPAVSADDVKKLRGKLKFERVRQARQSADMAHPGPSTLAPAGTDSRQNGTAQAGQAAPAGGETLATAAAATKQSGGPGAGPSSGSPGQASSGGGDAGNAQSQGKGHPAGVPTGH